MERRTIEILAKTNKAVKEIDDLKKEISRLNKEVADGNEGIKKGFDKVEKSASKTAKGLNKIGTALKRVGIGLLIAAFAQLQEVFSGNQKVVDGFRTVVGTLRIAFSDLFKFLDSNVGTVVEYFKSVFDDPVTSIKNLAVAIKDNLIERVQSAVKVVGFLGESLSKVFKGDFEGAFESAKNAGKELVDVYTGVDNSFEKVVVTTANYTKSIIEQSKATVDLNNQRILAQATNEKLLQQFDEEAEVQRKIRDDVRLSINERIAANDALGEILKKQEVEMLKNAQMSIDAAKQELLLDQNSIEAKEKLILAEKDLADVKATVRGFEAEQQTNEAALQQERIDLEFSKRENQAETFAQKALFDAEQIENEGKRLQKIKQVNEEIFNSELKLLQDKAALYKQDTQQFQDAQNQIATLQAEFYIQKKEDDKAISEFETKLAEDVQMAKLQIAAQSFALIGQIAKKGSKIAKAAALGQATVEGVTATISAYKTAAASPITTVFPAYPFIQAGLAAGFAAVNVAKIAQQDMENPSPSLGGGGGSSGGAQAPAFNVVGASPENQLAEVIGEQEQKPVKAFVVSNEISNQQELDRNITEEASIG